MPHGSEFNSLISQFNSEQKQGYQSQQRKPGWHKNNHPYLNSSSLKFVLSFTKKILDMGVP